jgi:hypothetical protein
MPSRARSPNPARFTGGHSANSAFVVTLQPASKAFSLIA